MANRPHRRVEDHRDYASVMIALGVVDGGARDLWVYPPMKASRTNQIEALR
jgi:hypothetical protein